MLILNWNEDYLKILFNEEIPGAFFLFSSTISFIILAGIIEA